MGFRFITVAYSIRYELTLGQLGFQIFFGIIWLLVSVGALYLAKLIIWPPKEIEAGA
jgi:hypothetical protein